MRSIRKACIDAATLAESCKIKRDELVAITIDSRGGVVVHLWTEGFIRIVQSLRVPRSKLRTRMTGVGDLHARFTYRGADWMCIVRSDSEAMQAILAATEQRALAGGSLRINGRSELLGLPAPATT